MKNKVTIWKEFAKGIWENNPVLVQVLGLCPTLAVTATAANGIAMALATTFVLIFSSLIISSVRKLIPTQVRIASYIVIIATFVTIVDIVMKAKFPEMSKNLGPYIPLIVVNCIILGRQEAFSAKNNPFRALIDSIGMGTGFLIVLTTLGGIREIFGKGTLLGFTILGDWYTPWLVMILPAGAFLTLGFILGGVNFIKLKKETRLKEAEMANALEAQKAKLNRQEA